MLGPASRIAMAVVTAIVIPAIVATLAATRRVPPSWFRSGALIVEVRHRHARNRPPQEALDREQLLLLFGSHERKGVADGLDPPGAADAVHVIFRRVRDVVIDHVRNVVHVD